MQTLISVVATTIALATMATWPLLGYLTWRFRRELPRLIVTEATALGRALTPNGTGRWSMTFYYALGEVARLTRREEGIGAGVRDLPTAHPDDLVVKGYPWKARHLWGQGRDSERGSTQVLVPVLIVATVVVAGGIMSLGGSFWIGIGAMVLVAALVWCWDYLS